MKKQFQIVLAGVILGITAMTSAQAAVISWTPATLISGSADVITEGAFVTAANVGTDGLSPVVNGVTFTAGNAGVTGFTGDATGFGAASGTFAGLSTSDYRDLLASGVFGYNGSETPPVLTLTLTGLLSGNTYKLQTWLNDSSGGGIGRFGNVVAGNSRTLDENNSDSVGGVGQFTIGTFIADGTSQIVTYSGGNVVNQLNAYQLRDLGVVSVPEPNSLILGLTGVVALVGTRRRKVVR